MTEPTIPLKYAELLHVAMSTIVHVLDTRTDYPVENMEGVITTYRQCRDKHLMALGYDRKKILMFTEAATEALVAWLEEREIRKSDIEAHFAEWKKELLDEPDHP